MKLNRIFFYILILFTYSFHFANNLTCENLTQVISKNTPEIISLINSNIDSLQNKSHSCIDTLMKYGKLEALDYYLNELSKRGKEYKENLEISLNTMLTQINDVYNKHKYSSDDYQEVFPASKWAQSLDQIFIEVKFAHKYDSPGCLEIKNLKVDLKEKSVQLTGYCVLGDVPIKMNYYIETYDKIDTKSSKHFTSSVGRYQFYLTKKKSNTYWKQLLSDKMKIPPNMRVWFEMKEKYHEQLSKFEIYEYDEMLQAMIEAAEKNERKRNKKEKKDKDKNKNKKNKKIKNKKSSDL